MQDNYTTKGKHLTIDSRRLIERWKKEGKSNREIASLLGKAPQTIHTKIKRRTVRKCLGKGRFKEVYSADYAQQSYENNRKHSVKRSSVTKELKEKILHYHNQKFLPEMMVLSSGLFFGLRPILGTLPLVFSTIVYPFFLYCASQLRSIVRLGRPYSRETLSLVQPSCQTLLIISCFKSGE
ncbi:transposase [Streptococcus pneumoniae]|nr:transposase [Streptococcus pneumoniae]